jgi:hypothetical protein
MFIGHFAVGFAAKRAAPKTPLTVFIVGALFADMLWPILLLLGVEHVRIVPHPANPFLSLDFESYPWSHSLVMTLGWALLYAWLVRARSGNARGAAWAAIALASHWVLDWVTHVPDLPIAPGLPVRVGLGLWHSVTGTVVTEVAMLAIGLWLYLRTTRARSVWGHLSLWSVVAFLGFAYYGDVTGPPPPSVTALATVGLISWVLTLWFVWIDRTRELRAPAP